MGFEPKTICCLLDASGRLLWWCHKSDKLSVLFELYHCRWTYSHFQP